MTTTDSKMDVNFIFYLCMHVLTILIAFLNTEGYFFNNVGYDRYGGYLDKNFEYFIKDEKDIT